MISLEKTTMPAIKRWRRGLSAALSLRLLASASGCRSAEERAIEHSGQVQRAMTCEEVQRLLGPPERKTFHPGQDPSEVWHYTYRKGLDSSPLKILFAVVLFSAIVAFVVATRCSSLPGLPAGEGESSKCGLRILFVPDTGRVRRVEVVR
jgi:hypothetical protein